MIFGTDTSKWQPLGTYDPGSFEIVNAEDPYLSAKIVRNDAEGRPWGLYVWVNEAEGGQSLVARAQRAIKLVGDPALGVWWDYEDRGVEPWQLKDAFKVADSVGLWSGYYSGASMLDHSQFLDREWWLAQYPWPNDGSFPGMDKMHAPRDVTIWQFSSGGNLDRNVIVDEAWYFSNHKVKPPPPIVIAKPKGIKMWCALLVDSNWVDVWFEGVIVEGFANDTPNMFGVGPKLQSYLDRGAGLTLYTDSTVYTKPRSGVRAQLLKQ